MNQTSQKMPRNGIFKHAHTLFSRRRSPQGFHATSEASGKQMRPGRRFARDLQASVWPGRGCVTKCSSFIRIGFGHFKRSFWWPLKGVGGCEALGIRGLLWEVSPLDGQTPHLPLSLIWIQLHKPLPLCSSKEASWEGRCSGRGAAPQK